MGRDLTLCGGLDLGGTKIQAVVVDPAGRPLGDARGPTPLDGGPPEIAAAMGAVLREAVAAASSSRAACGRAPWRTETRSPSGSSSAP